MRRLRRLVQKRSLRWSEGVCVLEGVDLVDAALGAGREFEALYVDASATRTLADLIARAEGAGVRVSVLAPGVIERVADAQTPQPVLATVRFDAGTLTAVSARGLILVLHDLRDPGNVGTIIRSADAAGATAVILTGQSVDPVNPKTLRASAGSYFHLPVVVADLDEALAHFRAAGATLIATVVRGGTSMRRTDLRGPAVVVIGNEAGGLDERTVAACDASLTIEMAGRSESLNAGVAASLIAFEALRQRESATDASAPPSLGPV